MNKNTFFVVELKNDITGKVFAYAEKVNNCVNLFYHFSKKKGYSYVSINSCDTWNEAQEIAKFWNNAYKKNGIYDK